VTPASEDNVVVDTNVWVMAHKLIEAHKTSADSDCAEACTRWLTELEKNARSLVVDDRGIILRKYWEYLEKGQHSAVRKTLGLLTKGGWIKKVKIEFDENDCAILPPDLTLDLEAQDSKINDEDWKFIAVALACNPHAPIVNAADSDWARNRDVLAEYDLWVEELCPELIEQTVNRRP
jgi:hypothetical protein